jgi:drug/metabolite transporter (DMT)-like permease
MSHSSQDNGSIREELLVLLPVSSTLAGLCIAAVTLFHFNDPFAKVSSVTDDVLAICSLIFLIAIYLIFWALRTKKDLHMTMLVKLIDSIFLLGITALVGVGFLMVYALV